MGQILAAADIGSNTVHLLVAEVIRGRVVRITNESEWIALGETVATFGEIPTDKALALVKVLQNFQKRCRDLGAPRIFLFGTEAMRQAKNHDHIVQQIVDATGWAVDIIGSQKESELSVVGSKLDCPASDIMLEMGGGSLQVAWTRDFEIVQSKSVALGSGRIAAESGLTQPPSQSAIERAKELIAHEVQTIERVPVSRPRTVACGGVARGIWRALHPDGERTITREEIEFLTWATARLESAVIERRFMVKTKRANTLLPGSLVYGAVMDHLGISEIFVSEYGVREGAILEMSQGGLPTCPV